MAAPTPTPTPASIFKPALMIVDVQEDFCPPNGTLAVPSGRSILPTINHLLTLPFVLKIATKDWHPANHISFASSHPHRPPLFSTIPITNPFNADETHSSQLWPDHCIQHTPGACLVPELDVGKVDRIVEKGVNRNVEMYSAFYDPFLRPRVCDSGLVAVLRERGVSDVYVVGLAFDYCVRATARDARKEGFRTYVVREGTRAVVPEGWEGVERELGEMGVSVVGVEGMEVRRVADLGKG